MKAFTMIELIFVIVVIGIISSVVTAKLNKQEPTTVIDKAVEKQTNSTWE